jgi:hypothetical protein
LQAFDADGANASVAAIHISEERVMAWLNIWNRLQLQQRLERLASEIADCSHALVWERSHRSALAMRLPEAQGYVRARAMPVIHQQTMLALLNEDAIDRELRSELLERATRAVVDSVTHELLKSPGRLATRRMAA